MIIDAILDRKDGKPYDIEDARYIYREAMIFEMDYLARAFDMGTNEDCQKALCDYIDRNEYNPAIKDYVMTQQWVD